MALPNRLGITDDMALAREEERISKRVALAIYRDGTLSSLQPGTFSTLAAIHQKLFSELYDFAGSMRTVNIAKGNFRFASALYLVSALKAVERMP